MVKARRRSTYPEPGSWVTESIAGMPDILPPADLPEGMLTIEDIREQVSYEGLGFCIYELVPAKQIASAKLAKLWREARQAMQKVVSYLEQRVQRTDMVSDIGGETIDDDEVEI